MRKCALSTQLLLLLKVAEHNTTEGTLGADARPRPPGHLTTGVRAGYHHASFHPHESCPKGAESPALQAKQTGPWQTEKAPTGQNKNQNLTPCACFCSFDSSGCSTLKRNKEKVCLTVGIKFRD